VREGIECLAPQLAHIIHTLDDIKHAQLPRSPEPDRS
jgi:hypothetical protein